MEIEEIQLYGAPNIFSLREPIVKMKVRLGELADIPTKDITNFNSQVFNLFPGIADHKCATGYVGGFVDRLKEGTYLAHVTEHLCLELQRVLGYDMRYGKARQVEGDLYNVIYACRHLEVGRACGIVIVEVLNNLILGLDAKLSSKIEDLKQLCSQCESEASGKETVDKPIISITGTNGKTTTTRMIKSILTHSGLKVGMTTTHGIYIGDRCVEEGDTTGPASARRVLYDKEVEAAVLETARGGIVREGLAYEKADIAVFTNLTEDHLGIDDIHTMEELLNVKSLVVEAVKEEGACVLNADDPWVMKAKEKAKGNLILFSMSEGNEDLSKHIKSGGCALYVRGASIYLTNKGMCREIMKVQEIPATLNGALKHNIYNSMAAIGAAFAAGISVKAIKETLQSFNCDVLTNPGRFNIYELGDFKVVLDYGHNTDGYRVTIDGLKKLNPVSLIGVIGIPGDRRNEDIKKLGLLSGQEFDRVIIKEDRELRGRLPLEVADILLGGVLEGGMDRAKVQIIQEEEAALKSALQYAQSGDVIVVFFEKMEPLVKAIHEYNKAPSLELVEPAVLAMA